MVLWEKLTTYNCVSFYVPVWVDYFSVRGPWPVNNIGAMKLIDNIKGLHVAFASIQERQAILDIYYVDLSY